MEFPNDIKQHILSYLPYLYRKPLHLDVIKRSREYRIHTYRKPPHLDLIKRSELFIDFRFNRMYFLEIEKDIKKKKYIIGFDWIDSVMIFRKLQKMVDTGELVML